MGLCLHLPSIDFLPHNLDRHSAHGPHALVSRVLGLQTCISHPCQAWSPGFLTQQSSPGLVGVWQYLEVFLVAVRGWHFQCLYLQCTGQFQATESDPIHYLNCIGMEKPDSLTLLIMSCCGTSVHWPWALWCLCWFFRHPLPFLG